MRRANARAYYVPAGGTAALCCAMLLGPLLDVGAASAGQARPS